MSMSRQDEVTYVKNMVHDLVLSRHAGLKAESLSQSMADARLLQAELWPNPELAVAMENIGGTSPRNEFRGAETTVTMTQPVPLPGKRALQRRVASYDRRLAGLDYDFEAQPPEGAPDE